MRLQRPALVVAGIALSVGALALALRGVQWEGVRGALARLDAAGLATVVLFIVAGLVARAERWRIATAHPMPVLAAQRATALGFLLNYVYPARAGDVIKVVYLHRASRISLGRLAMSAMMDRMMDVLVLLLAGAAVLFLNPSIELGKGAFFAVAGALVAGMVFLFSAPGHALLARLNRRLQERWTSRAGHLAHRVIHAFLEFRAELLALHRVGRLALVVALVAASDYAALLALVRAFGWELPALAPVVVWVAVSLGASLPSAPAGIGIHQLACLVSLGLYRVEAADAIAYSVVLQAASLAAILLCVAVAFALPRPAAARGAPT